MAKITFNWNETKYVSKTKAIASVHKRSEHQQLKFNTFYLEKNKIIKSSCFFLSNGDLLHTILKR